MTAVALLGFSVSSSLCIQTYELAALFLGSRSSYKSIYYGI
jgi:hypothetical protein